MAKEVLYFNYAITELKKVIDVCKTNVPINEEAGNEEQAKIEKKIAGNCKKAISVLKKVI